MPHQKESLEELSSQRRARGTQRGAPGYHTSRRGAGVRSSNQGHRRRKPEQGPRQAKEQGSRRWMPLGAPWDEPPPTPASSRAEGRDPTEGARDRTKRPLLPSSLCVCGGGGRSPALPHPGDLLPEKALASDSTLPLFPPPGRGILHPAGLPMPPTLGGTSCQPQPSGPLWTTLTGCLQPLPQKHDPGIETWSLWLARTIGLWHAPPPRALWPSVCVPGPAELVAPKGEIHTCPAQH